MDPAYASALAGLVAALTGLAGWRLSVRAQQSSGQRQRVLDQGPYVESLQGWSREIVAWYQGQLERAERACQEELREQRMECDERIRGANSRATYWKDRALGKDVSDDTPPEDHT